MDVRFSYDNTKLQLSNIETNEITNNKEEYFRFEDEFKKSLDIATVLDGNVIKEIISFNPPVEESEHIIEKEKIGKVITTNGGVLLGKMSFQMISDTFDISGFNLVVNEESSPNTGIKINLDGLTYFDSQSTFKFADRRISKNANLTNIIVSSEQVNGEDSTYKEYDLTPTFNKDTTNYEITLLEYLDTLDIKATQSYEKSTMQIKVPKRNKEGNLVYDTDGETIIYEEKEIKNNIPIEVTLNKLGEPDTIITIIVESEDKLITKQYELVIKRPYGTIKGKSTLANFDNQDIVNEYFEIYGKAPNNRVTVNLYKTGLARWEEISDIYEMNYENPYNYEDLEKEKKEISATSKDDGTYTIYVIPGEYDVQVTRLAYLDYIYKGVVVNQGDIIDMGTFNMAAGDANRDGVISQEDLNEISRNMDKKIDETNDLEKCNPTQIGEVIAEDLDYANKGQDKELQIVYF